MICRYVARLAFTLLYVIVPFRACDVAFCLPHVDGMFVQVHKMPCLSSDGQTIQDCLPDDGQVWKVQFDEMGSLLATSAVSGDSSSVCIWELNPKGQWCLHRRIIGAPDEPADNAGMLQ